MTPQDAQAMAQAALRAWGGGVAELVQIRENIVFRARLDDGRDVALRLHRPQYRSPAQITAELSWCAQLAAAGFPAPAPVPCADGKMTVTIAGRSVSCVTWLAGDVIGTEHTPLGADRCKMMRQIGALIAQLHAASAPQFDTAMRWDAAALIGPAPRWGRFWENPAFDAADQRLLNAARRFAAARLSAGQFSEGAIHGDLLRENILSRANGLALIDFDDCGHGYLLYDLATALIQSFEAPDFDALSHALLTGYAPDRAQALAQDLPLFVMLRAFASAGWVMSRAALDDPRAALYAARARIAATRVLEATE